MLYVFLVDTGTMVTFDMNLAMESVARLRTEIARVCRIPEDKQVLLISGGENLIPTARVGSYSAGTDTNPIFLFSKSTIESAQPPSPSIYYGSDRDLKAAVDGSLNMPSSYETVVARAQLALQFHDMAREDVRSCERLVHDQHLQHQGWAAVIANLDDITAAFRARTQQFRTSYEDYFAARDGYREILRNFNEAIVLLGKTPLLPCLLKNISPKQSIHGIQSMTQSQRPLTLLEWISLQDSKGSLQQMAEQAAKEVEQFDKRVCDALMAEVAQVLADVNNTSMKEVKGLEDRLCSLEQIMFGARKIVQEQADMAQGFVQNQNRAGNLRDPSILPDLCASHKTQMILMLTKHQQLRDIQRKCSKAKEELSINLHTRLRWVMYVEKSICDCGDKLTLHQDNVRRLKRRLEILQQMYNAPKLYAMAVVEVLRRKQFSRQYSEWAEHLAGKASSVHELEVARRKQFMDQIGRHFLLSLFTGLNDLPPAYATEPPQQYDQMLPPIVESDMIFLQEQTPELAHVLQYEPSDTTIGASIIPSPADMLTATKEEESRKSTRSQSPLPKEVNVVHLMDETLQQSLDYVSDTQEGSIEVLASPEHEDEDELDCQRFYSVAERPVVSLDERDRSDSLVAIESNDFTTADFYIEESLPSSYSDGHKQMAEKMAELQRQLQERSSLLERKERELATIQKSLENVNGRFKMLGDVVGKDSLKLRHEIRSVEKLFQKERDDMMETIATVAGRLTDVIKRVTDQQVCNFDCEMTELKRQHESTVSNLGDKLNVATAKLKDSQKEVGVYHEQLEATNARLKLIQEESETKLDELKATLTAEHTDAITKLTLEQELELEKIKMDFAQDLETRGLEQDSLRSQLAAKSQELELCLSNHAAEKKGMSDDHKCDMENLEVKLRGQCDTQSMELRAQLLKEHAENMEQLRQETYDSYVIKERELLEKHARHVEDVKNDLELAHRSALAEMQQKCEAEKEKAIDEAIRCYELKLVEERANSRRLEASVETQTNPVAWDHVGSQTVGVHTDSASMQTVSVSVSSGVSQTPVIPVAEDQTQTLKTDTMSSYMQTSPCSASSDSKNELITSEGETQTEDVELLSLEVQTSMPSFETLEDTDVTTYEKNIQTCDTTVLSASAQTSLMYQETVGVTSSGTQTRSEPQDGRDQLSAVKSTDGTRPCGGSLEVISGEFHVDLNDFIALEKHGQIIAEINIAHEERLEKAVEHVRQSLTDQHKQETDRLVARLQKEKEASLSSLRSSITAEQQVAFNAAVDNIVKNKNKVIENFKLKETAMLQDLEKERGNAMTRSQEKELEERLQRDELRKKLDEAQAKVEALERERLMASFELSSVTTDQRVNELKQTLREKESEVVELRTKMMDLSMSASMRGASQQDKVSIMTCNVGDTVLLCLDERHDQYVVFTVGSTLHFLHSDCLETLGLKNAPGEARKSWVLAEISEKEYCQAKKSNNRFRVPVGTKFYRVKAKSWDKDRLLTRSSTSLVASK